MKVLIIGGGGREHALEGKIHESPLVDEIFCAPGNGGTSQHSNNVNILANDIPRLLQFAKREKIDLTVVGPEEPLVLGIVDAFRSEGLRIFGPDKAAARLEGSKLFAKETMVEYGIPTAKFVHFTDPDHARVFVKDLKYLDNWMFPLVIKANGLAAGKGVYIPKKGKSALAAIMEIMVERRYGDAGDIILFEEFLKKEEASYISLSDRKGHLLEMATSQDHKRAYTGDKGPNTGGMGAYSPAPVVTPEIEEKILNRIMIPIADAMIAEGCPFEGFLYAGLMIDAEGNPRVLEFNVRMGDPETQPLMMRMKNDIVPIILAALEGRLDECRIEWDDRPAVCVVMAANGYPDPKYKKGFPIMGISEAEEDTNVTVYHAGTKYDNVEEQIISTGGRVLGVTALGNSFLDAQMNAYRAVNKIKSDNNLFWRTDIAHRAINR